MQLPITAVAIRASRALGRSPTSRWIDWAVEQQEAGRDGPNLRILAGLGEPFHYFETIRFVDGALTEVGVSSVDEATAVDAYSHELISALTEASGPTAEIMSELAGLCVDSDYPSSLMPFYLFHFARQDLVAGDEQHYWPGADQLNIDAVILQEARDWLSRRAA